MRRFEIVKAYLNSDISLPKRATTQSAGYDIISADDVEIMPNEIVLVKTGLKVKIPIGEVLLVFPRSSLALQKSLTMSNNVGVIDADYYNSLETEGHIMVPILNRSSTPQVIKKGERFCQGIFTKFMITTDDESSDETRHGGFGSTTNK